MNSDDKGESFIHIEFQAGAVGRKGLMYESPVLTPEYLLPSLFVPGSLFLFTSATGRTGVHTALKYGSNPIRYVTPHFRDWRSAASLLRHRNRAARIVFVCGQKPYPV